MIAIMDYGIGNLFSVKNALDSLGIENKITSNKDEILSADKIILPGVGAFEDAMNTFKSYGFDKVLDEAIKINKPILGICVGMQLLFERDFEYGIHEGLKIFEGDIVKFDEIVDGIKYKIPHMGWNQINVVDDNPILKGCDKEFVYFVHSYYCPKSKNVSATTNYAGKEFVCAVKKGNIYATQFHPEKSGDVGLRILKNFGEL